MEKTDKKLAQKESKFFTPEKAKELEKSWDNAFGDKEGLGVGNDEAKDLETIKLILAAIMDSGNLESLSSLTKGQIDDINDAVIMFEVFQDPLILVFIEHRLKLNRSLTSDHKNLLSIFSEIAGKTTGFLENGLNSSVLGNRFK